eukprot:COSAG06_NODE_88_length_24864_cov_7.159368_11_plen_185_part_00
METKSSSEHHQHQSSGRFIYSIRTVLCATKGIRERAPMQPCVGSLWIRHTTPHHIKQNGAQLSEGTRTSNATEGIAHVVTLVALVCLAALHVRCPICIYICICLVSLYLVGLASCTACRSRTWAASLCLRSGRARTLCPEPAQGPQSQWLSSAQEGSRGVCSAPLSHPAVRTVERSMRTPRAKQ